MHYAPLKTKNRFSPAARAAVLVARQAKMQLPDDFGEPKLFIARTGARSYTWELRRFGGVVLQRGAVSFDNVDLAREQGERALAALCASPELQTFKRQNVDRVRPSVTPPKQ